MRAVDEDPPIDESPPSLGEVREGVTRMKGGKAAGDCNITVERLSAEGEAVTRGLHAVLKTVWPTGTNPPDWRRGLVGRVWTSGPPRTATTIGLLSCSVFRYSLCPSVPHADSLPARKATGIITVC